MLKFATQIPAVDSVSGTELGESSAAQQCADRMFGHGIAAAARVDRLHGMPRAGTNTCFVTMAEWLPDSLSLLAVSCPNVPVTTALLQETPAHSLLSTEYVNGERGNPCRVADVQQRTPGTSGRVGCRIIYLAVTETFRSSARCLLCLLVCTQFSSRLQEATKLIVSRVGQR